MHRDNASQGRPRRATLIALLALLALLGLTAAALTHHYSDKALPGTRVLGTDVGGMDADQIADLVTKKAQSTRVQVNAGASQEHFTLTELGATPNANQAGQDAVDRHLTEDPTVQVSTSVNRADLDDTLANLLDDLERSPVNASLKKASDGGWEVSPGQVGQVVDTTALAEEIAQNAQTLEDFELTLEPADTAPEITNADARDVAQRAEAAADAAVEITGPGDTIWEPDSDTRRAWVSVTEAEGGDALNVVVEAEKVGSYVDGLVGEVERDARPGIEQVDSKGKTVRVLSEAEAGRAVTNADDVKDSLLRALEQGDDVEATLAVKDVPGDVAKVNAPGHSGAEDPGHLEGVKWVDINLKDKTLTAYEGANPVFGPRTIVDGGEGYETVTGSYEVYLRLDKQDMTNQQRYPEGHPKHYYTKDVPWVQYFQGGYAIHGAYWRDSFGYSDSHGCVNMSVSDAKWMYDWADEGTRVEVHH